MMPTETKIRQLLSETVNPYSALTWSKHVKGLAVVDAEVALDVQLGYPGKADAKQALYLLLSELVPAEHLNLTINTRIRSHKVQDKLEPHANIKNIIAVGSGKGGVGKSTVSSNLALALRQQGARVGILDADIYGPSQPLMLGVSGKPEVVENKNMLPHEAHGIQVMSIGFLIDSDDAMIWRGPMVSQALQQLLNETRWGDLDYLIIDLPPGTGDIQLTLLQKIPVAGAVIVTTPQNVAVLDAKKALQMFNKLNVPTLGLVENMSMHTCSQCGHEEAIFGRQGGSEMAENYSLPLLVQLPLDAQIRKNADSGTPTVAAEPNGSLARHYNEMALKVTGQLATQPISKVAVGLNVALSS